MQGVGAQAAHRNAQKFTGKLNRTAEIIKQKMWFVIMQKKSRKKRSTCIMNLCLILFMCSFVARFSALLCYVARCMLSMRPNLHTHTQPYNHKCEVGGKTAVVVLFSFLRARRNERKSKMVEYAFILHIRISSTQNRCKRPRGKRKKNFIQWFYLFNVAGVFSPSIAQQLEPVRHLNMQLHQNLIVMFKNFKLNDSTD